MAPRKSKPVPLPYENATSGRCAKETIEKILRSIGASSVGVMEDFDKAEVLVQFTLRGQTVVFRVPAKGYAAQWLQKHPYSYRMRISKTDHERKALEKGLIAIYSILRDLIKSNVMALNCGAFSFEGAFLGQIMLPTGETVLERIERDNLLSLPPPSPAH